MSRFLILILLTLVVMTTATLPKAIASPAGGGETPSAHSPEHGADTAGDQVSAERKRKKRKKKRKKTTPTCFGLAATISDHTGEITGTKEDDVIIGDAGPNTIRGGNGGFDRICAGDGDDTINADSLLLFADGGPGDDDLIGSVGSDLLIGGDGDDEIFGFNGDDQIFGEDGIDFLIGNQGEDRLAGGAGTDTCGQDNSADTLFAC